MAKDCDKIDVTVVGRRCVYLNDFRIAGSKPYVSENLPQHSFTITVGDVLMAMPMLTLKGAEASVQRYLQQALAGFADDPADSDYQRGYEAALKELASLIADAPAVERV